MEKNIQTQSIFKKVKKDDKYAQISNELISDRNLSYKALGIATYILSKPEDWQVYISDLVRNNDGERSVRNGIKELIEHRYMQRYRVFDKDTGKVHHWETLVSEEPFAEKDLISSVKETYLKDEEGNIVNKKISIKSFERYIPIVLNREVVLHVQNSKVENNNEDLLHVQNVQVENVDVENLHVENEGQLILNNTKTNFSTNTNSSSSSKDKSYLVEWFMESICELKKTTMPKFQKYVHDYDYDFIAAIITHGEETGAKSFKWFETTIESYIEKNIVTADGVVQAIKDYRESKRKAKNRALKDKDEKVSPKVEDGLNNKEFEEVIKVERIGYFDVSNGENLDFIKEDLKKDNEIGEVQFKTWIEYLGIHKVDERIIISCLNEFSMDIIENRYLSKIRYALAKNNISGKPVLALC